MVRSTKPVYHLESPAVSTPTADHGQTPDECPVDPVANLAPRDAARLPAKLQWPLVAHLRAAGAFEDAEALLDRIAERSGETARLLEERARLAFVLGRTDEAAVHLRRRADFYPSATAQVALARLYLETDRLLEAAEISNQLMISSPDLMTVAALAADVAQASGDIATARAHHVRVLEERGDNAAALLALARLALEPDAKDEFGAPLWFERALAAMGDAPASSQLTGAAAIADRLDHKELARDLRDRARQADARRASALVEAIRTELGGLRPPDDPVDGTVDGRRPRPNGRDAVPAALPPVDDERHDPTALSATGAMPLDPRVVETLQRDFGHPALRPGQEAVIANVLARRDTLAIMPTGAGKSLTFQLPAMLLEGTTLVISPLIALMKDQVESLPPAVRQRTALVNSTLSPDELRQRLDDLAVGAFKLVYVAPERLRQHAFLRALRAVGTALVVIDEAHCISLWGHDFRPDYLSIPKSLPELGEPPLLAITATATPAMARAIAAGLGRNLDRVQVSLFRPNLFYEVHQLANREQKVAKVIEVCRAQRGAGIVYVSSRKDAEAIAGLLRDRGVGAIPYHAGLDPEVRARNQERFMRGQVRVVVATVAFGMGIDKADVRFIVHLNPPRSLEAYAQESGRAGRDGQSARCVLLTAPSDQTSLNRQARRDELDLDTLRRVYVGIKRAAAGRWAIVNPASLLPVPGPDDDPDDEADPRVALGLLERAGLIMRHPDAPVTRTLRRQSPQQPESTAATDEEVDRLAWARFSSWSGLDDDRRSAVTVRTAEACAATDLNPTELDRVLGGRPDFVVRDGPRAVCLEVLPIGGDAGAALTHHLDRARSEARLRIAQVIGYAGGGSCRHATLAAHLGETLPPCRTSCDVCARPAAGEARPGRAPRATGRGGPEASPQRAAATAADALAALDAVRTLPFPMGKTGLIKLLTGSVESRVRADRAPRFGALADLSKGKVDALLDRLVEDGFLHRDLNHEYKVIRLTQAGADADLAALGAYDPPPKRQSVQRAARAGDGLPTAPDELDAPGEEIVDRLRTWRRARAVQDAVPPYVVAHDSMLHDLAAARPSSPDELAHVKGFGPARVEKYGPELLAILAEN